MVLNKQDSNTLTSADMQTSTQLTKDYAELIKSRTVLEGVIAQLNLNITLSAAAWQTDGRYFYRQPYCNDHSI